LRKLFVMFLAVVCGLGLIAAQSSVAAEGGVATVLFNFANGTDTWAADDSNADAGTTAQSSDNAANSAHSLQIDTIKDGWFGPAYSEPQLPLYTSEVTKLLFNITTTSEATSQTIAVQVGSNYQWCQTSWGYIDANKTTTVTVDLSNLIASASKCGGTAPADTREIRGIWVFFSGGGTYYLNSVHVQ